MHWGAYSKAAFGSQNTAQAQHFGSMCLYRPIPNRTRIYLRARAVMHDPVEYCVQFVARQGAVTGPIRPGPESGKHFMVLSQQLLSVELGLPDSQSQIVGLHTEANTQASRGLVSFADRAMGRLSSVLRYDADLLCPKEIWVAAFVSLDHGRIFGQCGCDTEFLRAPVGVYESVPFGRLGEAADPSRKAE